MTQAITSLIKDALLARVGENPRGTAVEANTELRMLLVELTRLRKMEADWIKDGEVFMPLNTRETK